MQPGSGQFPPPQGWAGGFGYGSASGRGVNFAAEEDPGDATELERMRKAAFVRAGNRKSIGDIGDSENRFLLQKQDIDLHQDTYSWLMLTLVKTWQSDSDYEEKKVEDVTHIGFLHGVAVYFLSIGLEGCIIVFFMIANRQLASTVEDSYFREHYHMDLGRAAELLRKHAADGVPYTPPDLLEACKEQSAWVNMTWIYYVTLTFWLMTMVTEVKEAVWLGIHILGVPTKPPRTAQGPNRPLLHEDVAIVRLESWMKVVIFATIPALRLLVAFVLMYAGSTYLILSTHVTDMVIKTVALQFVLRIDDVAAQSLLTMGDMDELRKVKIHTAWGHPARHSLWDRGLGGMFYIVFILTTLLVLVEGVYGNVFNFRYACGDYHLKFPIDGVTDMMPSLR